MNYPTIEQHRDRECAARVEVLSAMHVRALERHDVEPLAILFHVGISERHQFNFVEPVRIRVVVYFGTSSWTSRTASASESGSSSPRIQSGVCVRSARLTTHHVMTPSVVAPKRWAPFSRSDIVELRSMKESPVRHDALAIARNSTEHRYSVLIRELDTGSRLMSRRDVHFMPNQRPWLDRMIHPVSDLIRCIVLRHSSRHATSILLLARNDVKRLATQIDCPQPTCACELVAQLCM